jgi:hypothetical protein
MLHIDGDRVMTRRVNAGFMDTSGVFVRVLGYQLFRANNVTSRGSSFSMHVTQDRTWVNRLTADELAAPQPAMLQNEVDAAEAQIATLQTRATTLEGNAATLTTRVESLENNPVAFTILAIGETLHYIITGRHVVPIVAGDGVEIEAVTMGIFVQQYIRICARPWYAGFIKVVGVKVSSYARHDFTMVGKVGDQRQIQMAVAHPQGRWCAVTMTPHFAGRANVMCNSFAEGDPRIFTFFMSTTAGAAIVRDFSFVIH